MRWPIMTEITSEMPYLSGMTDEMTDWLTMKNERADYDGDASEMPDLVGNDG